MTENRSTQHRKHLHSQATLARAAATPSGVDLTRHRGQGNGLRVHAIYFAALSLTVLVLLIVAIVFASAMM